MGVWLLHPMGPHGTPSKAYTISVPDQHSLYPDGQHTLAFYIKCVPSVGAKTAVQTLNLIFASFRTSDSCMNSIEVSSPALGVIGHIRQERVGCSTRFAIMDETETVLCRIQSGHLCCNFKCGKDFDYEVSDAVTRGCLSRSRECHGAALLHEEHIFGTDRAY